MIEGLVSALNEYNIFIFDKQIKFNIVMEIKITFCTVAAKKAMRRLPDLDRKMISTI